MFLPTWLQSTSVLITIVIGSRNTSWANLKAHQDVSESKVEGRATYQTSREESTTVMPHTTQQTDNTLPASINVHDPKDTTSATEPDANSEAVTALATAPNKRKAKQQADEAIPKRSLRSSMKEDPLPSIDEDDKVVAEDDAEVESGEQAGEKAQEQSGVVVAPKKTSQRFLQHKPLSIMEKYNKDGAKKGDDAEDNAENSKG